MTPITWMVNPPSPPTTEPPRTEYREQTVYVRRNNGEFVDRSQHRRELDDAVLAALARISPASADEVAECLPFGILTRTGRVLQSAEVTVSLRRLYKAGSVWRDGNVWGVE